MSDPTLSDSDFKNEAFWILTTPQILNFRSSSLYFLEIQKQIKNRDASATQNELRQMTFELRRVDQEIHEKNDQIEKLNRDLRKVNLQSFVRETNSTKVKR